eukprot:11949773-Heterocapsa_arctica.AAC.1
MPYVCRSALREAPRSAAVSRALRTSRMLMCSFECTLRWFASCQGQPRTSWFTHSFSKAPAPTVV